VTIGKIMKSHPATVSAGDFKARCLKLMDEVALTRRPLVITKYGKAVARIVPMEPVASVFGGMRGTGEIRGDIVKSPPMKWDAER
jgi:prevent-host-death family protein